MHNLRNMKDSLGNNLFGRLRYAGNEHWFEPGVRKEVRVMFATVITVVVVLIAVSIVPVLGSGSPNALLQVSHSRLGTTIPTSQPASSSF